MKTVVLKTNNLIMNMPMKNTMIVYSQVKNKVE